MNAFRITSYPFDFILYAFGAPLYAFRVKMYAFDFILYAFNFFSYAGNVTFPRKYETPYGGSFRLPGYGAKSTEDWTSGRC